MPDDRHVFSHSGLRRSDVRRLLTQAKPGPVRVYARVALAAMDERGVRLSADEVLDMVIGDEAVTAALIAAIVEMDADAG